MKDLTIVDNLCVVDTIIVNNAEIQFKTDGEEIFTDSLTVARVFEKSHKNVLRAIDEEIGRLNFEQSVTSGFIACNYQARNLKQEKFYYLSKEAFTDLIMNFTGAKAKAWKKEYRIAFNKVVESHRGLTKEVTKLQTDKELLLEDNIRLKEEVKAREQALLPKTRETLDKGRAVSLKEIREYFIANGENPEVFKGMLIRSYMLLHILVIGDIPVNIIRDRLKDGVQSHHSGHNNVRLSDFTIAINMYSNKEMELFNEILLPYLKNTVDAIKNNPKLTPKVIVNGLNNHLMNHLLLKRGVQEGDKFRGKNRAELDDLVRTYALGEITSEDFVQVYTSLRDGRSFTV